MKTETTGARPDYTVRKTGDNYGLYFRGSLVESGVFATRVTAEKHKAIAESERRARTIGLGTPLLGSDVCSFCERTRVLLVACMNADPDAFICSACHADQRIPSTAIVVGAGPVMPTRAQYLAGKVTFEAYYRAIACNAGVSFASGSRAFIDRVKRALVAGDKHLNTIPLAIWDGYAIAAQSATGPTFRRHGDSWSLAGGVCVAKQAARDAAMSEVKV